MAQDKEKRVIAPHSFWETGTLFEGRNSLGKQISLRRLHQNTVVFLPYTHSLSNAEIVIVLQWEWEITCNWATRLWSVDAGWPFHPFPTGLVFGWELLWFPAVPEDKNVFCGECFYSRILDIECSAGRGFQELSINLLLQREISWKLWLPRSCFWFS